MRGLSLLFAILLAVASPAPARDVLLPDDPRIRREQIIPLGDDPFWPSQVLHGSTSSPNRCITIRDAVWVDAPGGGECIRYFTAGLADRTHPDVMVYIHGDYIARSVSGKYWVWSNYARHSPSSLELEAKRWSQRAKVPAIYIGRPGVFGSSGDHKEKARPREVDLINATLDLLKRRYGISRFHLAGQSGGGHSVASLLPRRQDIGCAVMSNGAVAIKERNRLLKLDLPDGFYDPLDDVPRISRTSALRIILVSDPEDRRVPFASQALYVDRLRAAGLPVLHILATAKDEEHHGLATLGRLAAALCVQGMSDNDIVGQVTAPEAEEKEKEKDKVRD